MGVISGFTPLLKPAGSGQSTAWVWQTMEPIGDYRVIAAGPRQDYPPGLSARSGSWKSRFLFVLKDRHGQERFRFN